MTIATRPALTRAEINRQNAAHSTGPRGAHGKMRVSMNALKHGLRAKTLVLPGEDEQAYHTRLDAWNDALQPRDTVEQFMVARAVHASWNLDRLDRALEARREAARYADADRLAALAEQVAALGRRLIWDPNGPLGLYPHADPAHGDTRRVSWSGDADDPDDPARLVARLEGMTLGCAWLLERWGESCEVLEDGLLWQAHDRFKAIRLLGRQPLDAVDDKRVMAIYLSCWAMEPGRPYGFGDLIPELTPEERTSYFERLNAREPLGAKPESPEAARSELLALIAEEEERLEAVLAGHLEREEAEAAAAQAFDATTDGERLRGYEAFNERTVLRIVEALRKRHQDEDGTTFPGGRARRDAKGVSTAPEPLPAPEDPGSLGSEAVPAAAAPRGRAPVSEPCPPGGGAGHSDGGTPATRIPTGPIGADSRLASPAEGGSPEACVAAPPEFESPAGHSPEPVESDPGEPPAVPADSPPMETARDDQREAYGLTEEEVGYRNARILEVLGCGPPVPTDEATSQVPFEVPGLGPARTEPRPPGDPSGASAGLNNDATEVPGSNDRGPRPAPNGPDRPMASARRLAEAVLALFALIGAAGLPAASALPVVTPTAASPSGPIGGMLARWSSHDPTWADWLCSSRAPDDPAVVPHEGRESRPIPASPG